MRILIASTNDGKLREYERLLSGIPDLVLETMATLGVTVEVDEDRDTFEANAVKKATEVAAATGLVCLADDSGLEVDALGGRPGVRSARYSGPGATDASNNAKTISTRNSRRRHESSMWIIPESVLRLRRCICSWSILPVPSVRERAIYRSKCRSPRPTRIRIRPRTAWTH